jgi:hemolysin E
VGRPGVKATKDKENTMALDPATAASTVKGGIEAADTALTLYNRVIDQVIPWQSFDHTVRVLKEHEAQYSKQAGLVVGHIQFYLNDSKQRYAEATQAIFEWCNLASDLLQRYLNLFIHYSEQNAISQRNILSGLLGQGVIMMGRAQAKLLDSSMSFNTSAGKLLELKTVLNADFADGSAYFNASVEKLRKEAYGSAALGAIGGPLGLAIAYAIAAGVLENNMIPAMRRAFAETHATFATLHATIARANVDIATTKTQLQTEIRRIGDLKTQIDETNVYIEDPNLVGLVSGAATRLIGQCAEYRKRHGGSSLV